jgi:acetoin:2,6-dichlorophenolindophenol oxidoreductase subunit beta
MSEQAEQRVKVWQAINLALVEELESDERVLLFGEDVARPGGTFGATRGLMDRFGEERVRDTPISEQAILGAGVGMAMVGMRPVCEILFADFLGIASDQLVNQAAKTRFFSGGRVAMPLTVRAGVGTGFGMGAQHSQNFEGWYAQIPGLKVCWPSTPRDVKGLLKAAIRDDGPVLFLETLSQMRLAGPVGDADEVLPFGLADVAREGEHATVVTYGATRVAVMEAAEQLAGEGISVEVVDLRSLMPWDAETVCESVARTNRCLVVTDAVREYGPSGEIAGTVSELAFDDLDAPVARLTSARVPAPQFEDYDRWRVPGAERIAAAVRSLVGVEAAA